MTAKDLAFKKFPKPKKHRMPWGESYTYSWDFPEPEEYEEWRKDRVEKLEELLKVSKDINETENCIFLKDHIEFLEELLESLR